MALPPPQKSIFSIQKYLVHQTFTDQIFLRPFLASFTDKNSQNLHAILCYSFATTTWHGFTKGVSVAPLLLLVGETRREIVTFLQPYIFAKRTASDSRESILSV